MLPSGVSAGAKAAAQLAVSFCLRLPLGLRQAGTWDPLLQCLHLDTRLLGQQNTKKLQGTKNNCVHAQLGQILDKIQKDQKPNSCF